MDEIPEFRVGEFVIEAKLGEGGMGAVYKARQTGLDRYVAIKVLPPAASANPEFVTRFEREAKAAAAIVHPNIIQIYTIGRANSRPYFAMEYVEGRDLEQLLVNPPFAPNVREAVEIVRACCQALAMAADRNITHRDIKPANIMLDLNGVVKVMDFGLARVADPSRNNLTMEGTVMGTPNYMPPEQGQGEEVDPRADQYSLGCVFYEMLAGQPLFAAATMAQILYKHIYEAPRPIGQLRGDLPPGLDEICHRMLAKKKEERFAHPMEIVQALERLQFPPDTPPNDLRKKVRAARAAIEQNQPPKDRRTQSMELSQDLTLMSLVGPMAHREPAAQTQGANFAQTLLSRGPSGALSMAGGNPLATGGSPLGTGTAGTGGQGGPGRTLEPVGGRGGGGGGGGGGALEADGDGALEALGGTTAKTRMETASTKQQSDGDKTQLSTMAERTTQVRKTGPRPAAGGPPATSNALSLVDKEGTTHVKLDALRAAAEAGAQSTQATGLTDPGTALATAATGVTAVTGASSPWSPTGGPPPGGKPAGGSNRGLVLIAGVVVVAALAVAGAFFALHGKSNTPGSTGGGTAVVTPPTGSGDLVTVPFSQLPAPAGGVQVALKIDGMPTPLPTQDQPLDVHKTYALVFSKPGYTDLAVPLTLDLKSGVTPPLASIHATLQPTPELAGAYDVGRAKQTAGDFAGAQEQFEKVVALDPTFRDAQARLDALTQEVSQAAKASDIALRSAQQAVASRHWTAAIGLLGGIPADAKEYPQAQKLLSTAQANQDALTALVKQMRLDLGNGKFADVDTRMVNAVDLAAAGDADLAGIAGDLKAVRADIDQGTQLFLDGKYAAAKVQFESAKKIAPHDEEIIDKLRKIDMALKPSGETGQLIQEVKDAVAAGNFTKASERLKKIPDDFQDIPLVENLTSQVLRGLNRKSIEDFLASFDHAYIQGDDRDLKRHLTLRPEGELADLDRDLGEFDHDLKFLKSQHSIVKLAFQDRGGRTVKVLTRWRYDVESLPYGADLKGDLPRELTLALEQGQWAVTDVKTGAEVPAAETAGDGGTAPTPPTPNTVGDLPPVHRLTGTVTAVHPQTVTASDDPAKLVSAQGEATVTISLTREEIDHATQGAVGGKMVFDVYTPDKVVSFPLSKVNAVIEGKYIGSLRVDVPGTDATVCVVQSGQIADLQPGMVVVQSPLRGALPKMPSLVTVAVTQTKVHAEEDVKVQLTVVNPESNVVHYQWSSVGGGRWLYARTNIPSNEWFPPALAGECKIEVVAESVYGQHRSMAHFALASLGPDTDHRPHAITPFAATHQPGAGKVLSLCFDETNTGYAVVERANSYVFTRLTSDLAGAGDISLMRQEDATNLKVVVSSAPVFNGTRVFVLDRKNNRVTGYPAQDNLFAALPAAAATYGGPGEGAGKYQTADDLVVTPLGEVAILDGTARTVSLFTPGGRYIMSFGSYGQEPGQLDRPVALAVDGRGHAFVLDAGRHCVIHFDGGRMVREVSFDVGDNQKNQQLAALAIDAGTGRLFVLDRGLSRVYAVDTTSGAWLKDLPFGRGPNDDSTLAALSDVDSIAVDQLGRVYVVSHGGAVVQQYSLDGEFLGRLDSQPAAPGTWTDLAIAPDGGGYLLDAKAHAVARLSASGLLTRMIGAGTLTNPVEIACDPDGNLLVLDPGLNGGSVARFSSDGKALGALLAGQCADGIDLAAAGGKALVLLKDKGLVIDLAQGKATATPALPGATQAAIDAAGRIFYAAGGAVHTIKADGGPGPDWQVAFKSLGSLCASPTGMVYAVDPANHQLTGVDGSSGLATVAAPNPPGCAEPAAVGIDSLGHVYLLDGSTGGVVRYIPNAGQ
ncbi:MAG: protein kinase domain-containing protein [Planctomycetota bacterium]